MRSPKAPLWLLAAAALPAVAAALFLLGCCVLPLHDLVHRLAPLCQIAAGVVGGASHGGPEQPAPAPQRRGVKEHGATVAVSRSAPAAAVLAAVTLTSEQPRHACASWATRLRCAATKTSGRVSNDSKSIGFDTHLPAGPGVSFARA